METLTVSYEQIIQLVKQLPSQKQGELFELLLELKWGTLSDFTKDGEEHARLAAWKRDRDWDIMTDEERIDFVNDIVHEDRLCSP